MQFAKIFTLSLIAIAHSSFIFPAQARHQQAIVRQREQESPRYRLLQLRELLGQRNQIVKAAIDHDETITADYIYDVVNRELAPEDRHLAWETANAVIREANRHQMDPVLLMSLIQQESQFDPHAIGGHGEHGLMQIKPSTAKWIAEKNGLVLRSKEDLFRPAVNIRLGALYLQMLRGKFGRRNPADFLSAYNVGPNMLRTMIRANNPPQEYMGGVLRRYRNFNSELNQRQQDRRRPAQLQIARLVADN